jgi:hypothetical protein
LGAEKLTDMENISFFRYELQDFKDAQSLVLNRRSIPISWLLKVYAITLLVIIVILVGIYLSFNLLSLMSSGLISGWTFKEFIEYILGFKDDFPLLPLLLVPALLVFLGESLLRFRFWILNRNNPDVIREERKFSFAEQGVNFSTSASDSNVKWNYFKHVIEGQKHFVLVKTKNNYMIVPKRLFSNTTDEARFRDLVENNLGPIQKRSW